MNWDEKVLDMARKKISEAIAFYELHGRRPRKFFDVDAEKLKRYSDEQRAQYLCDMVMDNMRVHKPIYIRPVAKGGMIMNTGTEMEPHSIKFEVSDYDHFTLKYGNILWVDKIEVALYSNMKICWNNHNHIALSSWYKNHLLASFINKRCSCVGMDCVLLPGSALSHIVGIESFIDDFGLVSADDPDRQNKIYYIGMLIPRMMRVAIMGHNDTDMIAVANKVVAEIISPCEREAVANG